eukprot:6511116-Pyramimonas_sp.AAC.2
MKFTGKRGGCLEAFRIHHLNGCSSEMSGNTIGYNPSRTHQAKAKTDITSFNISASNITNTAL